MFGHGVPEIDYLTDKVRLTFHLQHCMGVPDEEKVVDVSYDELDKLPPAPPLTYDDWTLEKRYVCIDIRGRQIVFVYENYRETYSGAWSDEWVEGPYKK